MDQRQWELNTHMEWLECRGCWERAHTWDEIGLGMCMCDLIGTVSDYVQVFMWRGGKR